MDLFEGVVLKELKKFEDHRGWLCEFIRSDETDYKLEMGYASLTLPGKARGPHEHKEQSDYFIFFGPGDYMMYLWENRKDNPRYGEKIEFKVGESYPCLIIVPPGVVHGYKCIGDIPAFSINLPNKLYAGVGKKEPVDEIRWETMEDSPFKIN